MANKKQKKQFSVFKGIIIFAIVSFFTWLLMNGLLELLKIDASPWLKVSIGAVGLFIAGVVGWRKF